MLCKSLSQEIKDFARNSLKGLENLLLSVKKTWKIILRTFIFPDRTEQNSSASRAIINENDFIRFPEAEGYKTFRFDKLTLIEKLKTIKYAKEIVAGAGSGLLFRNFLATHNNVRIIMSGSIIWNDKQANIKSLR